MPDSPEAHPASTATATLAAAPTLLAIIGPTASGKSSLAMELARRWPAEILSVDSMQVYRGMDVGTAKPSPAERAEVTHHLLDLAEPSESFSAQRFVELGDAAITDARGRGVNLIAVGGTPMYFKALFQGLFQGPSADPKLRLRLAADPPTELHRRLSLIDPDAASRIHPNDARRLIRALEVHELTGQPISSLQQQWDATPRHHCLWFGLHGDRDALNRRINARARQMIAEGWVDEVRRLRDQFGSLSPTAGEAAGYGILARHLDGDIDLADALEQIKIATRQLARRQIKFFRRFPHVTWLDAALPPAVHVPAILKRLIAPHDADDSGTAPSEGSA